MGERKGKERKGGKKDVAVDDIYRHTVYLLM